MRSRIYLDHAATSWPKPESVYRAMDDYARESGAPAGRGSYREAIEVERTIDQTRQAIAQLIEADDPRQILFTYSGTDSLTLAIRGLVKPGDHVITTVCDHNSVLRPLHYLEQQQDVAVTRIGADAEGRILPEDLADSILPNTSLIAMVHASNVTGALQPAAKVGEIARERGIPFLLDAAQTLGHLPVSVRDFQCDMLAAPGHKGLLGPTGTGILYLSEEMSKRLMPVRMGGTGSQSERDQQPETLPDKFESGNLNVPGIVGLHAGLRYIQERGIEEIAEHEGTLTQQLRQGLADLQSIQLYGGDGPSVGVLSLNVQSQEPQETAVLLDQIGSIQARAGFHCAPMMHDSLNTRQLGGTLRLSVGPFNTAQQIQTTLQVLQQIADL
ncbi:MAG: aminotransferase [Planctomycetaceae bacterium]|nr:aminotransferase [Planctomycetaceae bacterium]